MSASRVFRVLNDTAEPVDWTGQEHVEELGDGEPYELEMDGDQVVVRATRPPPTRRWRRHHAASRLPAVAVDLYLPAGIEPGPRHAAALNRALGLVREPPR